MSDGMRFFLTMLAALIVIIGFPLALVIVIFGGA